MGISKEEGRVGLCLVRPCPGMVGAECPAVNRRLEKFALLLRTGISRMSGMVEHDFIKSQRKVSINFWCSLR